MALPKNREELKENDHRKIGQDLDLFCFSDYVGPGLPLYTPRGTIVKDDEIADFEKWFSEELNTRVQFLETIVTKPDSKNDKETGGRHDVFFSVHNEDVGKFSIPRLSLGIRWIEDVLSKTNYKKEIYPRRVKEYKSWEA
jgi:hypothetical protein